jgi:hypothetical protein
MKCGRSKPRRPPRRAVRPGRRLQVHTTYAHDAEEIAAGGFFPTGKPVPLRRS